MRGGFSISTRKSGTSPSFRPLPRFLLATAMVVPSNRASWPPQGRYLYHRRLLSDREGLFFSANRAFLGRVTFLGVPRESFPNTFPNISKTRLPFANTTAVAIRSAGAHKRNRGNVTSFIEISYAERYRGSCLLAHIYPHNMRILHKCAWTHS